MHFRLRYTYAVRSKNDFGGNIYFIYKMHKQRMQVSGIENSSRGTSKKELAAFSLAAILAFIGYETYMTVQHFIILESIYWPSKNSEARAIFRQLCRLALVHFLILLILCFIVAPGTKQKLLVMYVNVLSKISW